MRRLSPLRLAALASLALGACARAPRPAAPTPVSAPPASAAAPVPATAPAPAEVDSVAALVFDEPPAPPGAYHAPHSPEASFDIDVHSWESHEKVTRYVGMFGGSSRDAFARRLERGSRYEPMLRAKLRAGGIPEDLMYLALVESGYDPHAVSRANAVGMWQFMAPTARGLGLRVDRWVDERRDPVRSTDAAVRMLRWLRGEFGSLFLAAAAYNGGPGRVGRGLEQLGADADTSTGDARFFALANHDYIRGETKNYVPQLIAAVLVAKEPSRYGLTWRRLEPFGYDSVRVPAYTPLAAVAKAASAAHAQLDDLNPHYLRGLTPPGGRSWVRVPAGAAEGFGARFEALDGDDRKAFRTTQPRKHETLAALARRMNVSVRAVKLFNDPAVVKKGKLRGTLRRDQTLRIPTRAVLAFVRSGPLVDDEDAPPLTALPRLAVIEASESGAKKGSTAKSRASGEPARLARAASATTARTGSATEGDGAPADQPPARAAADDASGDTPALATRARVRDAAEGEPAPARPAAARSGASRASASARSDATKARSRAKAASASGAAARKAPAKTAARKPAAAKGGAKKSTTASAKPDATKPKKPAAAKPSTAKPSTAKTKKPAASVEAGGR